MSMGIHGIKRVKRAPTAAPKMGKLQSLYNQLDPKLQKDLKYLVPIATIGTAISVILGNYSLGG